MTETKCSRDAFEDRLHELSGQPIVEVEVLEDFSTDAF